MGIPEKKLIMFDFDGVLVDTLMACYTINLEVNENLLLSEYKAFFEGNIYKAIRANGEPKKLHPDFIEQYDTHTRELKIPTVLKQALVELQKSHTMSIISSTYSDSISAILNRENCNFFEDILGADVHKDKTYKINYLLKKYNIKPADSVFITDTLGDIKEANKCEVKSIAVTWGFQGKEILEKGNPAVIIDNPSSLVEAVQKVFYC